jgi:hypothetical protein
VDGRKDVNTHETYLRGKPKMVGMGSSLDNRLFSAIIDGELSGNGGKVAEGSRGDGRALCTLDGVGEGVPALAVGEGRWCISGNVGAVMLTEGTENRGCRSCSSGRSITLSLVASRRWDAAGNAVIVDLGQSLVPRTARVKQASFNSSNYDTGTPLSLQNQNLTRIAS